MSQSMLQSNVTAAKVLEEQEFGVIFDIDFPQLPAFPELPRESGV